MSVNLRIKHLRQALNMSQAKFAQCLSLSGGYIAGLELGNRRVNDRIVKLICAVFGASELWLKNGEGEMFNYAFGEKLDKAFLLFKDLSPEFQDYVLQQMDNLLRLQAKDKREPRV